jgi:hypothetical protein
MMKGWVLFLLGSGGVGGVNTCLWCFGGHECLGLFWYPMSIFVHSLPCCRFLFASWSFGAIEWIDRRLPSADAECDRCCL